MQHVEVFFYNIDDRAIWTYDLLPTLISSWIVWQGCDGSVLLDDTVTLQGEKNAPNNKNALKGFKIIDRIKNRIESECPGIVSCADILTIAARDAVLLVSYILKMLFIILIILNY